MSRGVYAIPFPVTGVAVTAQQDLFDVVPATNKPLELVGLLIAQSSDAGDAQDEQLAWSIIRGLATVGSGGSAATVVPTSSGDAAASFTGRINDTAVAVVGVGSTTVMHDDAFNVRAGMVYWPAPEARIQFSAADTRLVVRLGTTPADSLTMHATAFVRELV